MAFDDDISEDWGDSDNYQGYGGGDDRNYDPEQSDFTGEEVYASVAVEDDEGDLASKWLAENDKTSKVWSAITHESDEINRADESGGGWDFEASGAPAHVLKRGQISHQDYNVQLEVERAIAGEADWSKAGLDGLSIAGALDANARAMRGIGRDVKLTTDEVLRANRSMALSKLRQDMKPGYVHQVDPDEYMTYPDIEAKKPAVKVRYKNKFKAAASAEVARRAMGQLQYSDDYFDKGPGSSLSGNLMLDVGGSRDNPSYDRRLEEQERLDSEMAKALSFVDGLSNLYMHPSSIGTDVFAPRRELVKTKLIDRFMNGYFGEGEYNEATGKIDGGRSILPLPNELGVMGLVPTRSYSGTTPYTRVEFAAVEGDFTEKEAWKYRPNLKGSLLPNAGPKGGIDGELRDAEYEKLIEQAQFARRVFREQLPNLQDESDGRIRSSGWYSPYGSVEAKGNSLFGWGGRNRATGDSQSRALSGLEQVDSYDFWNEAALLGLSMDAGVYSGINGSKPVGSSAASVGTGDPKWVHPMSGAMASDPVYGLEALHNPIQGPPRQVRIGTANTLLSGPPELGQLMSADFELEKRMRVHQSVVGYAAGRKVDGSPEQAFAGYGSEKGDMYGEKDLSQVNMYTRARSAGLSEDAAHLVATGMSSIETELGEEEARKMYSYGMTDHERYMWAQANQKLPEQGTPEWHAARKGHITASQAGMLNTAKGGEALALQMALEKLDPTGKLGLSTKFRGNAYTREGNDFEGNVLRSFLASDHAEGLFVEKDYFRKSLHKGLGATPDGRVFTDKGAAAGLLELKLLSTGSMAGALEKYTPQMQFQMMTTGEKKTHFYALDRYTGDYVYEEVHADLDMQEDLLRKAELAMNLSSNITTIREAEDLRNRIKSKKGRKASKAADSSAKFTPKKDADDPVMPFNPELAASVAEVVDLSEGGQYSMFGSASTSAMSDAELAGQMELDGLDFGQPPIGSMSESNAAAGAPPQQSVMIDSSYQQEHNSILSDASATVREFNESLKSSSSMLKIFGTIADDAAKVIRDGNDSGMSTVRLAAEVGMSANATRGMEFGLQYGGLSETDAKSVIGRAGDMQAKLNDVVGGFGVFRDIKLGLAKSVLPRVNALQNEVDLDSLRKMDVREQMLFWDEKMSGMSPEERQQVASISGLGVEFAAYDSKSLNADLNREYNVDSQAHRDVLTGRFSVRAGYQKVSEGTASQGRSGRSAGGSAELNKLINKFGSTNNDVVKSVAGVAGIGHLLGSELQDGMDASGRNVISDMAAYITGLEEQESVIMPDKRITTAASENGRGPYVVSNVNTTVTIKDGETTVETDNNGEASVERQFNRGRRHR